MQQQQPEADAIQKSENKSGDSKKNPEVATTEGPAHKLQLPLKEEGKVSEPQDHLTQKTQGEPNLVQEEKKLEPSP